MSSGNWEEEVDSEKCFNSASIEKERREEQDNDRLVVARAALPFRHWLMQFIDSLEWLSMADLVVAEQSCKFVYEACHYHRLWKKAMFAYRLDHAGEDNPFVEADLAVPVEDSSSLDLLEVRKLWKRRALQYLQETRPRYSLRSSRFLDPGTNDNSTISFVGRIPKKGILLDPRGCYQGHPFIPEGLGIFIHMEEDGRFAFLLYCQNEEVRVTFQIGILSQDFTDRGDKPQVARQITKDFGPGRQTSGWSFSFDSLGSLGTEDIRVIVQCWVHPKEMIAVGSSSESLGTHPALPIAMKKIQTSGLLEIFESPKFNLYFKLLILCNLSDLVRGANLEDRHRLQSYLLPAVMRFMKRELKEHGSTEQVSAACSFIWNALDTATFAVDQEDLSDLVETVLDLATHLKPETRGFGTIFGSLWNLPICHENRLIIARHQDSLLTCVAPQVHCHEGPSFVSHFISGLHLVTTLLAHGLLRPENVLPATELVNRGLDMCEHEDVRDSTCTGVSLTPRDFVDFFLPLLLGKNLEGIRFAAFFADLTYFRTPLTPTAPIPEEIPQEQEEEESSES